MNSPRSITQSRGKSRSISIHAIAGAVVGFAASFLVAYWDPPTGSPTISSQWFFPAWLTAGIAAGCISKSTGIE
jgi:hypothetical protein